jgi:hypothetical protein
LRAGCGVDAGRVRNIPGRRCGKPQDELADRGRCGRSARCCASSRVVPFPCDEFAVPGQQGCRCDGKDRRPPAAGDEPGEGAEPEQVRRLVAQALVELTAEDRVLVSQDQELASLLVSRRSSTPGIESRCRVTRYSSETIVLGLSQPDSRNRCPAAMSIERHITSNNAPASPSQPRRALPRPEWSQGMKFSADLCGCSMTCGNGGVVFLAGIVRHGLDSR